MARRGTAVDESVDCRGIGAGVAAERLLELAASQYRAVSVGAGRFRFARTYRPAWALFAGCALAPTVLGLLFLLVKRTETFEATVEEDHRHVRVRLAGRMQPQLLLAVREAMQRGAAPAAPPLAVGVVADPVAVPSGPVAAVPVTVPVDVAPVADPMPVPSPVAPSVVPAPQPVAPIVPASIAAPPGPVRSAAASAFAPPATARDDDGLTSLHPRLLKGAVPAAPVPVVAPVAEDPECNRVDEVDDRTSVARASGPHRAWRPLVLCFDTGERHALVAPLLVGRDPAMAEDEQEVHDLVAVDDPDLSVSKTHLAVRFERGVAFVTDRGSVNGTAVEDDQGTSTPVAAGSEVAAPVGATVRFGTRSFLVTEDLG